MKKVFLIVLCIVIAGFLSANTNSQAPNYTAKRLLQTALSDDTTKEGSLFLVEFPPGAINDKHSHPGDEFAYVLEGTFEVRIEGRETKRFSTGDVFYTPRDVFHVNRNVGSTPGRLVITFITDKGKPITKRPAK